MRLFRPFGKYFGTTVPVDPDFTIAEAKLLTLINGTDGGTWVPKAPIRISGGGLNLDAFPTFTASQTRKIRVSALEYVRGDAAVHQWGVDLVNGGITSAASSSTALIPLCRVHDGARLLQAKCWFQVPRGKTALPGTFPLFGIFRMNPTLSTAFPAVTALYSGALGLQPFPTTTSLSGYINSNIPNVITYTPDQNNNPIDRSTYDYMAEYVDDTTAAAPRNTLCGIELTFDMISDMRLP